jgi:hypothetical protein
MPMYMVKERLAQFKAKTLSFFKTQEGQWNKQNIIAILIAGFVGWLLITVTMGVKLKRIIKKIPILKLVFYKTVSRGGRTMTVSRYGQARQRAYDRRVKRRSTIKPKYRK